MNLGCLASLPVHVIPFFMSGPLGGHRARVTKDIFQIRLFNIAYLFLCCFAITLLFYVQHVTFRGKAMSSVHFGSSYLLKEAVYTKTSRISVL